MKQANKELRNYAKSNHVTLWQIASILGISEASMTRKMRIELPDAERAKIESIIDSIAENNSYKGE